MKHIVDIPRTAMEVFNMLPEGTLCEVIDNTLYMSPAPTPSHQRILGKFFLKIQTFAEENNLGEAFVAPCDVYLDNEATVVQPDVVFVKKGRKIVFENKGIFGSPDIIIEVLSTNKLHDQERKLKLYLRNSIPEYIIVEPNSKQVWHYLLQDNQYIPKPELENGRIFIEQLQLEVRF